MLFLQLFPFKKYSKRKKERGESRKKTQTGRGIKTILKKSFVAAKKFAKLEKIGNMLILEGIKKSPQCL